MLQKIEQCAFEQFSKNHLLCFQENAHYSQNYATNFSH